MKYRYGKNVLITGASSGIGLECAKLFAENGFNVWAVSRSCEESIEEYGLGKITYKKMDVTDEGSIQNCVNDMVKACGDIGIVIHSAGNGIGGASEDTPIEQARYQFETNYFGVLKVNQAVIPVMRKKKNGLVIILSSVAGEIPIPYQGHYSASKAAVQMYAQALRMEVKQFGIRVAMILPGDTKTGFTGSRKIEIKETSPYYAQCVKAVAVMEKDEQNGKPADSCAKTAIRLAKRKKPKIATTVGFDYKALVVLKKILPSSIVEFAVKNIYLR